MFLGQYRLSMGDDRSLLLPGAFQGLLAQGAYITRGFEQNLLLMSEKEFQAATQKVTSLNLADPSVRLLNRLLLAHAIPLDIDGNGRFLVPAELVEFTGAQKDLILIGQGDYIEVWSPAEWKKQTELLADVEANPARFASLDLTLA